MILYRYFEENFRSNKYLKQLYWYVKVLIAAVIIIFTLVDMFLPKIDYKGFDLFLGFLIANVLFLISSLICRGITLKVATDFVRFLRFLPKWLLSNIHILIKYIYVSVMEELFWRVFLQKGYFNFFGGIVLITLIFTIVHFLRREINLLAFIEFFIYFLVLSLVFKYTDSFFIAVTIHVIRNVYIVGINERIKTLTGR